MNEGLSLLKSDCEASKCRLVIVSILDTCLTSLNFGLLCEQIYYHFYQTGINWVFEEESEIILNYPTPLSRLTNELMNLEGIEPDRLKRDLANYGRSTDVDEIGKDERVLGYPICFKMPARFVPYDRQIVISGEDFLTSAKNPVFCIPADCKPKGGLAKAIFREEKPQEILFNQRHVPGGVATLEVDNPSTDLMFFCITRATCKDDANPELYYQCLCTLRELTLNWNLKQLSFPLLDWDRDFLTVHRHYKLLQMVFTGIEIELTLYPNYFLTIK